LPAGLSFSDFKLKFKLSSNNPDRSSPTDVTGSAFASSAKRTIVRLSPPVEDKAATPRVCITEWC
jgi:hypothetical protein